MSLNEFDVIEKYFAGLLPDRADVIRGIGDDAAVLSGSADCNLIVSTDSLISTVHFFPDADPYDVGYKSLAVNLSDMAAMAATPRWITLSLSLSGVELNHSWLSGFSQGLAELAGRYSLSLVGGDLCRGPLAITLQIIGECPKGREINRRGARPGDSIYLSGELGAAACALAMLKSGHKDIRPDFSERLLRPSPRIELGIALRGIASSMIDVSDGLLADLGHVIKSSRVGALLNIDDIPIDGHLTSDCAPDEKWQYVLAGGDDYELCFTVPEDNRRKLENINQPVFRIGKITAGKGIQCKNNDGAVYTPAGAGYSHF